MKINKDIANLEKSETIEEIPAACCDETAAVEFLEKRLWKGEPHCPHCESAKVYQMKDSTGQRNKRFLWHCQACDKSVHNPYRHGHGGKPDSIAPLGLLPLWRASTSKKGVAALEIKRQCSD